MRRPFVLEAESEVGVSVAQAQQWFMELEAHPERYRFETYAGFEFTQGGFGQAGSRFVTWERFYGIKLGLHFVLGEVEDQRFFLGELVLPGIDIGWVNAHGPLNLELAGIPILSPAHIDHDGIRIVQCVI